MLSTIVFAAVVALVQALANKAMSNARFNSLEDAMQRVHDRLADVHLAAIASEASSTEARELLRPAVAQLPKTRSRKTRSAGIGEEESPA